MLHRRSLREAGGRRHRPAKWTSGKPQSLLATRHVPASTTRVRPQPITPPVTSDRGSTVPEQHPVTGTAAATSRAGRRGPVWEKRRNALTRFIVKTNWNIGLNETHSYN